MVHVDVLQASGTFCCAPWERMDELVMKTDLSWHTLFKYGDSLTGFMLSAVYGTLLTPSMVSKWSEDEDGKCKLCKERMGIIQHILAGCKVALSQGRGPLSCVKAT